ncbi:atrial natriuretic peptide receptor 1 [Condylostylus longicornis]|uniref:atrial natriuretic peptide receptor 1 n=1 Tax=Condylostylus longicornis TaxID=2530218 RepID=UPI00244E5586|nr:atrial natriuretic peptide receptor 1 [Condylostylus longicornis]XP_055387785.1 atrial natriuretic peptide receptor 1 [Condylostylus longicornis]
MNFEFKLEFIIFYLISSSSLFLTSSKRTRSKDRSLLTQVNQTYSPTNDIYNYKSYNKINNNYNNNDINSMKYNINNVNNNNNDYSIKNELPIVNLVFVILLTYDEIDNANDCIMSNVMPTIELAIIKIQENSDLVYKPNVTVIARDTFCQSTFGGIGLFEIYSQYPTINVIFGLSCEYVLAPISRYAGVWEIPVISTSGRAISFNVKENHYDTLTRMMGSSDMAGNAVKLLLNHYNWTITAILGQNIIKDPTKTGNSVCYFCLGAVKHTLGDMSLVNEFYNTQMDKDNATKYLQRFSKFTRVVIMCADPESIREILLVAEELNMIDSGEYVFINIELFSRVPQGKAQPWFNANDTQENNERAKKAFSALLTVSPKQPDNDEYTKFSEEIKSIATKKYNKTYEPDESISTFVTSFYDAVLLYATALNESVTENVETIYHPINGSDMVRRMWNRTFEGITGKIQIDSNGDRVTTYALLDMNPETGYFEIVANFSDNQLQFVEGKTIHWAGGRTEAPPDKPKCGFDGSLCAPPPIYAILSVVLGISVIVLIIVSFIGFRYYKNEAEINSMTWKVNHNEVLPCETNERHTRTGSMHSLAKRGSQLTIYSEEVSLPGDRQLYIPIAFYRGCKVAIKYINETNVNLNRPLMLELKRMKDIQHEHLVKFFGACLDPPKCFLLTEYCPKGSLQDILENEQIQLDWMFKLSLMHDIVRGMHFLHCSEIRSHGNLKSSNCVVDSRFVLKICDFGLHQLRKASIEDDEENCNSYAYWKRLLWTAPELLRMQNTPREGTQKGDVYSFGIIVHEIVTRQGTFYLGSNDKSPKEIIELVTLGPSSAKQPSQPFRPYIDESENTYDDIDQIMVKCWAEDPFDRPDFGSLKSTIRRINKENETGNIVDNLMKRMERYANNLEGLVQERTRDYLEEKRKCEEVLYQLLPKSVAAQLIRGQPVLAETFDLVTIYFSDIVGFTAISAESTPMQVVQFLNDLYTEFDSIVNNFDVYKVETIGDAYMVVSGLPIRNGTEHVREIARLALALLDSVHRFKIHHRPNDQLKLRIGLHSGPCVAGVVGLKMPRYCLFGDTVNTASRMESNGEALKIHISHSTKTLLDQFGSFIMKERGLVPMKGKGEMRTYWLEGEKLPMITDARNFLKQNHNRRSAQSLLGGSQKNIVLNSNNLKHNFDLSNSHSMNSDPNFSITNPASTPTGTTLAITNSINFDAADNLNSPLKMNGKIKTDNSSTSNVFVNNPNEFISSEIRNKIDNNIDNINQNEDEKYFNDLSLNILNKTTPNLRNSNADCNECISDNNKLSNNITSCPNQQQQRQQLSSTHELPHHQQQQQQQNQQSKNFSRQNSQTSGPNNDNDDDNNQQVELGIAVDHPTSFNSNNSSSCSSNNLMVTNDNNCSECNLLNKNYCNNSNCNNSVNFNNIVKTNNIKNLKIICNPNDDSVSKSAKQPLLAKINT